MVSPTTQAIARGRRGTGVHPPPPPPPPVPTGFTAESTNNESIPRSVTMPNTDEESISSGLRTASTTVTNNVGEVDEQFHNSFDEENTLGLDNNSHAGASRSSLSIEEEEAEAALKAEENNIMVEESNFRKEVSAALWPTYKYIPPELLLESKHMPEPYMLYVSAMAAGKTEKMGYYTSRWDKHHLQVRKAIKEHRGGKIQAMFKAFKEWDNDLKKEDITAIVPTYDELVLARTNNTELFVEFISRVVLAARGKSSESRFGALSRMEAFDDQDITASTEAFALFTWSDKYDVWMEQIATGKRMRQTTVKPKYTKQGKFLHKAGMPFDVRPLSQEGNGAEVLNDLLEMVEKQRENVIRDAELLKAVKAHFLEKINTKAETRRLKEMQLAQQKRKPPPTIRQGRVSGKRQRQLQMMFPANFAAVESHPI